MLNIEAISTYIPKKIVPLSELATQLCLSTQESRAYNMFYGLKNLAIATGEDRLSLLTEPIKSVLQQINVQSKKIKYLIYAHTSELVAPFFSSTIKQVKQILNLKYTCTLSISWYKCVSIFVAIELVSLLLKSLQPDEKILLVTGEIAFTQDLRILSGLSIVGDAGAVMLVGKQNKLAAMRSIQFHVANGFHQGIWLDKQLSTTLQSITPATLINTIEQALKKANITKDQLKLILPHNVNLPVWRNAAKLLAIPLTKIYISNIEKYGHCFGADVVLNLQSAIQEGLLLGGDYFLMASIGVSGIFGAVVWRKVY